MKYSIIVSLFNQLKYLPRLIKSLEEQTFGEFEVHFCDNCSNDGTEEFFEKKHFNFLWEYHRFKKNTGNLSKNVNQGIKKAKGEHCLFITGDSFLENNYLEALNNYVYCDSIICGVRFQIDGNKIVEQEWRLRKNVIPPVAVLLPSNPYNLITGNGLCIPTEAFKKYGMWNEKIKGYGGNDNEIAARLYYKGYLFWSVPQVIIYHNWHKSKVETNEQNVFVYNLIHEYAR